MRGGGLGFQQWQMGVIHVEEGVVLPRTKVAVEESISAGCAWLREIEG